MCGEWTGIKVPCATRCGGQNSITTTPRPEQCGANCPDCLASSEGIWANVCWSCFLPKVRRVSEPPLRLGHVFICRGVFDVLYKHQYMCDDKVWSWVRCSPSTGSVLKMKGVHLSGPAVEPSSVMVSLLYHGQYQADSTTWNLNSNVCEH